MTALDPRPMLVIDDDNRTFTVGGEQVSLPNKQYELLRALARDPARLFTADELYVDVWGSVPRGIKTRALDSTASRLRIALGGSFVVNVWGKGYRLVSPGSEGTVELRANSGPLVDRQIVGAVEDALEAMDQLARALQSVAGALGRVSRQERERSEAFSRLRRVA